MLPKGRDEVLPGLWGPCLAQSRPCSEWVLLGRMGPGNDLVGGEVRSPGRDLRSRAGCGKTNEKVQRPLEETAAPGELRGFPFTHEYSWAPTGCCKVWAAKASQFLRPELVSLTHLGLGRLGAAHPLPGRGFLCPDQGS